MSKEVMVYFNSGNKAQFSVDNVKFTDRQPEAADLADGRTVVNWANVSFVRERIELKEDDE